MKLVGAATSLEGQPRLSADVNELHLVVDVIQFTREAFGHHHHPLRLSIPLPDQHRAGSKLGPILVEAGQTGGHRRFGFLCNRPVKNLPGCVVEIAKAVGLEAIGDDRK